MNETNTRKFSALVDELGYKLLAIELVYKLNDKELGDTLNTIADNWNMEFTEDNTGIVYVSNDEDEEEDYFFCLCLIVLILCRQRFSAICPCFFVCHYQK